MPSARLTEVFWPSTQSRGNDLLVRWVRGKRMRTTDGALAEISAALQFEWFFGWNWNAARDCLRNLQWQQHEKFLLLVFDADQMLTDAPATEFSTFVHLMDTVALEMSEPYQQSWTEIRPPKILHTLLQVPVDEGGNLRQRLFATGIDAPLFT